MISYLFNNLFHYTETIQERSVSGISRVGRYGLILMNLIDELFAVISCLERDNIQYAICGGIAVIIHGYPRLTKDIDIMVLGEDRERIEESVKEAGYTFNSGIIPFDIGKETERQILRITKVEGEDFLTLDFILVPPYLEEVWRTRENRFLENRNVVVVSRKGLILMKRIAKRPQDIADISNLGLEDANDT